MDNSKETVFAIPDLYYIILNKSFLIDFEKEVLNGKEKYS